MVPHELKLLRQWVVWRLEERAGDDKSTKVPYRPDGGGLASVTDPQTWGTAMEAWQRFQMPAEGYSGVGFVLTAEDPFCGIDLDHCRDPDSGVIENWAKAIVDRFDSYTEVTPSRTGLRIWVKGELVGERRRKGHIELYDRARYFTTSGDELGGPREIRDRQEELEDFCLELFPPAPPSNRAAAASGLSAYEVVERARRARNGHKFDRLMRGDAADYGSGSEADLALASMAAFWNPDAGVVEQVMRLSALWDEKWDRPDYRSRTIEKALEQRESYSPDNMAGGEVRGQRTGAADAVAAGDVKDWLTPLGTMLSQPQEDVDWLVDGMLITGGVGLFGAKPKVGKTTLLHQLALAVARGERFLNRTCKPGPVIYLALEENRDQVTARFRALGARESDEVHLLVGQAPQDALNLLRAAIERMGAVMAIVDPIQRLTRLENINDYSEVSNATDPLIALARESGCALVFSHHLGKSAEREGGDAILGSTALFGSVDTAVLMRRAEDHTRAIHTIQRYGSDLEPMVLGHSPETGASWLQGPAEDHERRQEQKALLDVLQDQVEPIPHKALLELSGLRWNAATKAIQSLVSEHRIERLGTGRRGSGFAYRLVRAAPSLTRISDSLPNTNRFIADRGNEIDNETGNETLISDLAMDSLPPTGAGNESLAPKNASPPADPWACPGCGLCDYLPLADGSRRCNRCGTEWSDPIQEAR